ncbi:MAG: macro domain-containing protein [candidate division Zixibacteria bacterium]|nr:macro domain-containing protein [candidate division Zixibacteria bacterium]MCI0595940.1 macro domain-containing protein [candidate division Zixibacteria bacterium]
MAAGKKFGAVEIELKMGDISEIAADAIVNAANNRLWMGSGVAGALKRRGGKEIEDEAVKKGPIKVGQAVETTAGKLPARWVIHAAAMGQDLRSTSGAIAEATENSLILADKLGAVSIAFPALGTGVGGFSIAECAHLMLEEARVLAPKLQNVRKILFVLFDPAGYKAFEEKLSKIA